MFVTHSMCGSCFFSTARKASCMVCSSLTFFTYRFAHMAQGARKESPGPAGGVQEDFAGVGIDAVHHESSHGARRVVFARVPGALQVVKDLFVDVAEMLPF